MHENYIDHLRQLLATGPFTQSELARRLGVTHAALNRWIQGHAHPQPRRIAEIEALYKQVVGYPSVTEDRIAAAIRQTERLRKRSLWGQVVRQSALQDELLLEHTYNSTSIEGTTFTKKQTEVVLFSKATIHDKSLVEHLEVTNHAAVLRSIFQKRYTGPVTEVLIQELHAGVVQGIRPDAGAYARHPRAIRGVELALTHPKDIPEEMAGLIKEWKGRPSRKTIREIADFHVHFELIHPFSDGNGRVGRLVMALQCLQEGLSPVVIENARKAEYYEVLEYAQKKSDGPFICFLADEMKRTAQIVTRYR